MICPQKAPRALAFHPANGSTRWSQVPFQVTQGTSLWRDSKTASNKQKTRMDRGFLNKRYAEGGIRTPTPYGATPSRWCVCQFRHFRTRSGEKIVLTSYRSAIDF